MDTKASAYHPLAGKSIAVGITGGIAAYKAADLVSRLRKLGADVVVVMTKNAQEFITPQTMETMSCNPVVTDLFARPATWEVEHIALAKRVDLFIVAPASANMIAKMALGLADDFLSTTLLATRAPILVAPAMNNHMWEHVATKANVATLKHRGVSFVGPGEGFLAEGIYAVGRLVDNEEIVSCAQDILFPVQDFCGKRVLVTAGPTREPIDPVRYLSNRSSGKMGMSLAKEAQARGAEVLLLLGQVPCDAPKGIKTLRFGTTLELYDLVLHHAKGCDVVIQAAAPGDFRAEQIESHKIKKDGDQGMTLRLVQNPDIAKALGQNKKPGQILVGFAAETQDLLANARKKLASKNCDMMVANDITAPGAGFDVATNIVSILTKEQTTTLPMMDKSLVAKVILDHVGMLFPAVR